MSGIIDVMKKVAASEVKKVLITELGVVTSVFPHSSDSDKDNYEINVKLKDKDVELRKVPVLTQHIGLSNIPHVGDLVLIAFINGDINSPVILGRLYNDEDRPPASKEEEIIYKPPYSKEASLKRFNIILPGSEDNVNIEIHDDSMKIKIGDSLITVKDSGMIEFKTSGGSNCIVVMDNNGVRIDSDADVQIHCKGNMTVECDKDLTFKAMNITMESQQSLKLKSGASFDIQSTAPLNIKSDATANLESNAPLTVKSSAVLTIRGSLVNIN